MPSLYNSIEGWFDEGFAKVYNTVISEIPDRELIVEVGCWKGKSSCYLLELIEESKKDINPMFVDTFRGDVFGKIGSIGSLEPEFRKNLYDRGFHKFATIVDDSIESASKFPNDYLYCVMLDGGHEYEYVKKEILSWKEKTYILAGHDYLDHQVRSAVSELLPGAEDYGSCFLWRKK